MNEANVTGRITWRDGELLVELALEAGKLLGARRTGDASGQTTSESTQFAMLAVLGPQSSRFADALGAARARPDALLAWQSGRDHSRHPAPTWRLALAGIAAIIAWAASIGAPGVTARVAERDARTHLAKLAAVRRDVAFAEREFAKLTAGLGEVAAFDAPRYPMISLLGDFARVLPDESALVTLRVVRDAGNLVVLTPRAAVMLTKLETVPGIDSPEIIGPVTRELLGGKTLERVTVRFRLNAAARRVDRAAGAGGA
jgi:hypothetical protein